MRPARFVLVWPLLAHAAAWAAFLWLVFWPFAYRGVSVQAVPQGSDAAPVVTNLSASFIETNGIWVVLPLLVPVVLTGLAYLAVWNWNSREVDQKRNSVGLGRPYPRVLRFGYSFDRGFLSARRIGFIDHGHCEHIPSPTPECARWPNGRLGGLEGVAGDGQDDMDELASKAPRLDSGRRKSIDRRSRNQVAVS